MTAFAEDTADGSPFSLRHASYSRALAVGSARYLGGEGVASVTEAVRAAVDEANRVKIEQGQVVEADPAELVVRIVDRMDAYDAAQLVYRSKQENASAAPDTGEASVEPDSGE